MVSVPAGPCRPLASTNAAYREYPSTQHQATQASAQRPFVTPCRIPFVAPCALYCSFPSGHHPGFLAYSSAGHRGLMTTLANADAAPSHRLLRVFLVLFAALEFLDALSSVQNI